MKSAATKMICRLVIVSIFAMPFQVARAGMIGTPQAISATSAQADRDAVIATLSRADVASQLQAQGVNTSAAKERVASMTDQEVRALAGQIDSLPAGASSSSTGWAIAIVAAILIWYYYK